jgi:hypothetical protein
MDANVLRGFITELHEELKRINDAILVLERMTLDKAPRGRKRKFESDLVRKLLRHSPKLAKTLPH